MYVSWKPLAYNLNLYPVISGISLDENDAIDNDNQVLSTLWKSTSSYRRVRL